jgi:hypothetical protein
MSQKYQPKPLTPLITLVPCKLSKDRKSFIPVFTPLKKQELEAHKSNPWSKEEDSLLLDLGMRNQKWTLIAREINTAYHNGILIRNQKQCRERWKNFIDPDLKKKPFTKKEDDLLLFYYEKFKSWAKVAKKLKNRNENQVKNRYRTLNSRKEQKKPEVLRSQLTSQFSNFSKFPNLESVSLSNYLSPSSSALIQSIPFDQGMSPIPSEFPSFAFQGDSNELFSPSFGGSLVTPSVSHSFFHDTKKFFQSYSDANVSSHCEKILDNFCDQNISIL